MEAIYFTHNRTVPRRPITDRKIAYYDLTLLLSGEMCWYVDGAEYRIRSGDIFLIKSGSVVHRDAVWGCDYFSFNFYEQEDIDLPLLIPDMLTGELRMLLFACEEIWKAGRELEVISPLIKSLLTLLHKKMREKEFSSLVIGIKKYISENINKPITLEDISASTFFSKVYCSSVFKREVGQSIISYVLDEKIKLAKLCILENMALKEVADYLGYSDYNYFSRIFKKRVGMTPIEYRKNYFT